MMSDDGKNPSLLHFPVSSPKQTEIKMMIYKIHILRVLAVTITLMTLLSILIYISPHQSCIQVSVSVQQFRPYPIKRTRVVQALDESIVATKSHHNFIVSAARKISINTDAFFRTRLVHRSDRNHSKDPENDDLEDENDVNYDGETYDEYDDSKVFEEGDFDYNETSLQPDFGIVAKMFNDYKNDLSAGVSSVNYSSQRKFFSNISSRMNSRHTRLKHRLRNITLINIEGVPIVEDTIYWSEELEENSPRGSGDSEVQKSLQKLRSSKVKRVEPPTWNRCGRPKNQFVVFEDESKACARYRAPHQYLVQGEIMSFYLARLLGITNVPVVALSAVDEDFKGQWDKEDVKKNLIGSKWETNTTVALIQWIENLERDKLPSMLLSSLVGKHTISAQCGALLKLPVKQLVELLQWSDLIIFDYITGNYDRVASMQDAADKERKPSILHETIHNVVRSTSDGGLWLIDNESGLVDSYLLLYGPAGQDGRFLDFHKQMLNTTCLFRRSTVERIQWLHHAQDAGRILMNLVRQFEPLFTPIKNVAEVSRKLQDRIGEVNEHFERCLSYFS